MALQYENALMVKGTLHVRTYDTETKTSSFSAKKYIPRLWISGDGDKKSFLNQQPLLELQLKDMKQYRETLKLYEDTDVRLYGHDNIPFGYIRDNFPNPIESDHSFHTFYIDIEVAVQKYDTNGKNKDVTVEVEMTPEMEAKARTLGIIN